MPTTDFLLTHRELETQAHWSDLAQSEEVLASHVIRVPQISTNAHSAKDGTSLRDSKNKAKQFLTFNGKTVVVKDTFVYSNKGFKSLNQAQLLQDVYYIHDFGDLQQWLIYYISKPLIGTPDPIDRYLSPSNLFESGENEAQHSIPKKKDITSLDDILRHFPPIGRHMQAGLDDLFADFRSEVEADFVDRLVRPQQTAPPTPTKAERPRYPRSLGSVSSLSTVAGSSTLKLKERDTSSAGSRLRDALERLVVSAIELFQGMDKSQLSLLGNTTSLSGPQVERLIERHVTEHFHGTILFPRICDLRREEDEDLESDTKQMTELDISQVGISTDHGQRQRKELLTRLTKGVSSFKKMETAHGPQSMLEILVETEKIIMTEAIDATDNPSTTTEMTREKPDLSILTNADLLVSMLLLVVIKSQASHLHAVLLYMSDFVFVGDNETGETGYALSTFEAVLSYISSNCMGLKKASRANRSLWRASKKGDLPALKRMLESDEAAVEDTGLDAQENEMKQSDTDRHSVNGDVLSASPKFVSPALPSRSGLAHVFPFQAQTRNGLELPSKPKKHVSMEVRSMSSSSGRSLSHTSTLMSSLSVNQETSIQQVCRTTDLHGNSALRMAIDHGQANTLQYLLSHEHVFVPHAVLEDSNNEDTSLLSAAVQVGDRKVIGILVDFLLQTAESESSLREYLRRKDCHGRTSAHYLFNAPFLIDQLSTRLPWQSKDKNGQTPLLAVCRSYDHDDYQSMVHAALSAASRSQEDGEPLHLDMHTDSKQNTLLHVANSPKILRRLLQACDSNPNAKNDKHFTPLMVASKFARLDSVRVFFGDERTDLQARDQRGLTAVELAKDDEVRNRIDDMVLLSTDPGPDGRITTIVRSLFVEDSSIRLVLKSGAPNADSTITVTTSRRSLNDFENLARWLSLEHPASWLPLITTMNTSASKDLSNYFRTPFQLPSRPSRAVLRDIQLRLDAFLQSLLTHPTFSTHEMVWEFFLVPDINQSMLAERAHLKAMARVENLREDYSPPLGTDAFPEVRLFASHASDQVRAVHNALLSTFRQANAIRNITTDLCNAHRLTWPHISRILERHPSLGEHNSAYDKYVNTFEMTSPESSPWALLHYSLHSALSTASSLLVALGRPGELINQLLDLQSQVLRHNAAVGRSQRWPSALGLLDETRSRVMAEGLEKVGKIRAEMEILGCELRYTRGTVAGELAGWQDGHAKQLKGGLRSFARGMVVRERERLEGIKRAGRQIGVGTGEFRSERHVKVVEGIQLDRP